LKFTDKAVGEKKIENWSAFGKVREQGQKYSGTFFPDTIHNRLIDFPNKHMMRSSVSQYGFRQKLSAIIGTRGYY